MVVAVLFFGSFFEAITLCPYKHTFRYINALMKKKKKTDVEKKIVCRNKRPAPFMIRVLRIVFVCSVQWIHKRTYSRNLIYTNIDACACTVYSVHIYLLFSKRDSSAATYQLHSGCKRFASIWCALSIFL